MTEIAVLTPDPTDATYAAVWPAVLARLSDALAAEGITTVPTPWTEHVASAAGLRRFPLVLPLLAWGYHYTHPRWLAACRTWQDADLPLANPAAVLAMNSDKRYLLELERRGVAIPATTICEHLSMDVVDAFFGESGADELIIKPTVSGGAWHTRRLRRGDALGEVPSCTMMLQPYLPTIESAGEMSLLYFGGQLSHAVQKRARPGDFRIQHEFGGTYSLVETPPPAAVALAEQTLAALDALLLYARIDMVPDAAGRWLLMEAELIEPDFYLSVDPRRGAAFARAVRLMLNSTAAHSTAS